MTQPVITNPILIAPFDEPTRLFRITDEGITDEVVEGRRTSAQLETTWLLTEARESCPVTLDQSAEWKRGGSTSSLRDFRAISPEDLQEPRNPRWSLNHFSHKPMQPTADRAASREAALLYEPALDHCLACECNAVPMHRRTIFVRSHGRSAHHLQIAELPIYPMVIGQ